MIQLDSEIHNVEKEGTQNEIPLKMDGIASDALTKWNIRSHPTKFAQVSSLAKCKYILQRIMWDLYSVRKE
jgi:hypothetical protein